MLGTEVIVPDILISLRCWALIVLVPAQALLGHRAQWHGTARLRPNSVMPDDEDITSSSHTSQGEEEVQHGRPIHLFRGGSRVQLKFESGVQLKFESGSGSRTSLP